MRPRIDVAVDRPAVPPDGATVTGEGDFEPGDEATTREAIITTGVAL